MDDEILAFGKYSIELHINGESRPIMIGNELTPILDKFEKLVLKYYDNEEDEIKIFLYNTEDNIIIKSYNSTIDK